ncbi:segregation/condensation protein A [Gammaproteobacteria bacterium]|nr:segregation/condensation protein A [Gammaproteobacteria bacterium]
MQNTTQTQLEFPTVMGQPYEVIPDDLFIPPNALELCLETFSGPMDLLLYLIKKENINILDLDVSNITDQYIEYINLMDALQFELAAEYLVMAATLAEIKSRMMLPQEIHEEEEEEDPKFALIKRLQEYQRYKSASEKLAILPRIDRDFFTASAKLPDLKIEKKDFQITKDELIAIYHEIKNRPDLKLNHQIDFEELSTQERIQIILDILSKRNIISFSKTLRKSEGRHGVVVTFLASLELAKDGHVELIQNKTEEIFLKSKTGAIS